MLKFGNIGLVVCLFAGFAAADPIEGFAVYGEGGVNVQTGATVNGAVGATGNLIINGVGTQTGDASATSLINLGVGATIDGDALAPSITNLGMINGTSTTGPFAGATVPTTAFAGGSSLLTNALSIPLVFTAGNYSYSTVNFLGGDVTFDTTGGDVNLFVSGNLFIGSAFAPTLLGSASGLNTEVIGVTNLLGTYYGKLIGTDAINVTGGDLTGSAWSKASVNVRSNAVVNGIATNPVPEPGSLALIGAAGLVFAWTRRRRRASA